MFKTGITKLSQLLNDDKTYWRKELKNASITLYDQILTKLNADNLAERILLLFTDERGAYKRTYKERFENFDLAVLSVLNNLSTPRTFHDMGVSDGRTALEFFEKIVLIFPNIHYFATDYNPSVFVIEKGKLKVTLSHNSKILEILFPPFVFNKIKRDSLRHYPLNYFLCFIIEKIFVNRLLLQYHQGRIQAKELLLFLPKVLQKAKMDQRFHLGQHDLLQPLKNSVDIIRAMNVLNPSYFSSVEFNKVIANIYEGLMNKGFLITGSNQEPGTLVNGGIYQKEVTGFKKVFESGIGSPIEDLLLNFKA